MALNDSIHERKQPKRHIFMQDKESNTSATRKQQHVNIISLTVFFHDFLERNL